jgi:C1A family cysteine protease
MEGKVAMYNAAPNTALSVQELVSCTGNDGQDVGPYSMNWIARNGVVVENQYPYTGVCEETCLMPSPSQRNFYSSGARCLPNGGPEINEHDMLGYGPMAISVAATTLFNYYGGILDNCGDTDINHSVLLVGYCNGDDGSGPHWILQNSWGADWGEMASLGFVTE